MSTMQAAKIFAQIFLICLLLNLPTLVNAELQGRIYDDDVVTEDGESFNVGELIEAIDYGNIDVAETTYNNWVKRRQAMLKSGTKQGILDLFIKHCHAKILYLKKDYASCIVEEDKVSERWHDYLNEGNVGNRDWILLKYNSLLIKKAAYHKLKDYPNSLKKKYLVDLRTGFPICDIMEDKTGLPVSFLRLPNYKLAVAAYEEMLPQVKEVFGAKSENTRLVKWNLAHLYMTFSRYSDAAKLFEEILKSDIEVYGETDEKTLESYDKLIDMYQNLGRFDEIGVLLNKAVPIVDKNLPDESDLKKSILAHQVTYYMVTGQSQKFINTFENLNSSSRDKRDTVLALLATSAVYLASNDSSSALKCTLQAWDTYEKKFPEDDDLRMHILQFMGLCYSQLNNYNESLKYFKEALDLSTKLYGSNSEETHSLMEQLASVYSNMNRYDKVLELSQKNYNFYVERYGNDSTTKLTSMRNIAVSYGGLGDYKNGITWAKETENESVRLCGENSLFTYVSRYVLAVFYLKDKQVDEGIKILESLPKQSMPVIEEERIWLLAIAYSLSSRWNEAIPLYEKVIENHEKQFDNHGFLTTNELMKLLSKSSSDYGNVAALHYRNKNFKEAFRTLERGRSRLLIDSYSEQIVKSSGILDKQEVIKLNKYKARLSNYAKQIDAAFKFGDEQLRFNLENEQRNLSNEYIAYKKLLQDKYPKYKNTAQANKLDLERDKSVLPADTAFVEYMLDRETITAFVFDNSGDVKAVQFDLPENFIEKCNLYRELLSYPDLKTMQKTNRFLLKLSNGKYQITLSAEGEKGSGAEVIDDDEDFNDLKKNFSKAIGDVLLTPLTEYISKYPNLIIAPDKELNNIPFETLEFNAKLAIESFNISYVPSFSVLKLMYEAGEKNSKLTNRKDLYAMGNPFYGNNDDDAANRSLENFFRGQRGEIVVNQFRNLEWENLPGTQKELNRVSEIFGSKKIFSEKSASESNLKASNQHDELSKYKYLLFSTHGLFMPYAPEYNSIVLSQGVDNDEDGYVTIGEWTSMNLNSDVVFLSACETGLGEYQAGEGIIGIPYALTIAGNKNTVMSLWKVYDAYTPEFVATFFKKMKEGNSAFIAINDTKREFLKSSNEMQRDPSIWSAFVLYGF